MTKIIMIAPANKDAGITTISNILNLKFKELGKSSTIFSPNELEHANIEQFIADDRIDDLLEEIYGAIDRKSQGNDYLIIDSISFSADTPYAETLNREIAIATQADIIALASLSIDNAYQIDNQLKTLKNRYKNLNIIGVIVNNYDLPTCGAGCAGCSADPFATLKHHYIFDDLEMPLLSCAPKITGENILDNILNFIKIEFIETNIKQKNSTNLTPSAFRYNLSKKAKSKKQKIVLPEGEEPRTIKAANIAAIRDLAEPILLGNAEKINELAQSLSINLSEKVKILDPNEIRSNYIDNLVELRKHKGVTKEQAEKLLQDNIVLGTMMVQLNEVDGLVSGAIHSTADTVRPALQLIKTKPNAKLVSSVFFMCLPEQVFAFADCAVNIDPTPEELADIAIQTADTAKQFGIDPRVAMISYSTGNSGHGADVEKVKKATSIVKELRSDIEIEGPIQYDAAISPEVAKTKLPNSTVAGKATVFVFPNLSTANPMAKGVQRSSNTITIGPLLQGLNKPANDLSRGCVAEDIVFTIALTAVQSMEQ